MTDPIAAILQGTYRPAEDAQPLSVSTQSVVIEDSLAGGEADLIRGLSFGGKLAVVSDQDTHAVLGSRVERALGSFATVTSIVLPPRPHADQDTVEALRKATRSADALIAVGSGTLNDLCKMAAASDGKPCAVFGTAPSMNGFTSVNASISVAGMKKTLPAVAPLGVFLDLTVLARAPKRMIRSGLGDSLCRATAQADWLLAHLLLEQPYLEAPFTLLAEDEAALLAEPEALLAGDLQCMRHLARTLVLSGFGMAICGGSQPASQGEHLISHYVEMMGAAEWPPSFHGEQIGVATLTMAGLQERLLQGPPPVLVPTTVTEQSVLEHFGSRIGAACWQEFSHKCLNLEQTEQRNAALGQRWEDIRRRILAISRSQDTLRRVLERAGSPTEPTQLHWPAAFYRDAVLRAREIRNRYTFLDLAAEAGLLDRMTFG